MSLGHPRPSPPRYRPCKFTAWAAPGPGEQEVRPRPSRGSLPPDRQRMSPSARAGRGHREEAFLSPRRQGPHRTGTGRPEPRSCPSFLPACAKRLSPWLPLMKGDTTHPGTRLLPAGF